MATKKSDVNISSLFTMSIDLDKLYREHGIRVLSHIEDTKLTFQFAGKYDKGFADGADKLLRELDHLSNLEHSALLESLEETYTRIMIGRMMSECRYK